MKQESEHDSSFTSLNDDYQSYWVSKTSFVKCQQRKIGHFTCMNKKCQGKNAIICIDEMCECKATHKKCVRVEINRMVDTIKREAYSFESIKEKINKIFENAIDLLSQMQEKLMQIYQTLFSLQAYSKYQYSFLSSLQSEAQNDITSSLMYEINAKIFDRLEINRIVEKVNGRIESLDKTLVNEIDKFFEQLSGRLLQLQNVFTDKQKLPVTGLLEGSKIINQKKNQQLLLGFFPQCLIDAQLLYRASENNFEKMMFHKQCDDVRSLLFLIHTEHGKIIGGYSTRSFSSKYRDTWIEDSSKKSFIFSVTEGDKIPITDTKKSIWNGNLYSNLICGFGYEIKIANKANSNYNSILDFSASYQDKKYPNNKEGWKKFTGRNERTFKIIEWEVWKVALF